MRFWNIVEYWSPNRDIVGEDWNAVLAEFIPRFALAKSSEDYQREVMALLTKAKDGHANIWSALQARPPVGQCQVPIKVRFVEKQPVIGGFPGSEANVVGSTTSGADGSASPFALPGGLHTMISGIGVFYPDKSPTQHTDYCGNPCRKRRDTDTPAADIEKMTKP